MHSSELQTVLINLLDNACYWLQTVKDELDNQIVDTEDLDMAEAITSMTWAQYCYNAALRIGTNILSQSLLDYMS